MEMSQLPKLKGGLVGIDGNAFMIMGTFKNDAKKAGWPEDEIKKVLDDAMSGDYNHLLATIAQHYSNPAARRRDR